MSTTTVLTVEYLTSPESSPRKSEIIGSRKSENTTSPIGLSPDIISGVYASNLPLNIEIEVPLGLEKVGWNIVSNKSVERSRIGIRQLLKEVKESRQAYEIGQVRRGTVDELMAELDD